MDQKVETKTHPTDDLLREHILPKEELLLAEMGWPGSVRVLSVGRYHARIDIDGWTYQYSIKENAFGERRFVTDFSPHHPVEALLGKLAWHRAAEAMYAVRKGHMEAQRNKALRKPKQDD